MDAAPPLRSSCLLLRAVEAPAACAVLDFFHAHDDYDYIWIIEYDVRFSGDWSHFFREYMDNTSDLIACHIRRWDQEPLWYWWDSHRVDNRPVPEEARIRAFLPIHRLSCSALQTIHQGLREGWQGHYETLVPTLLAFGGLVLEDLVDNRGVVPSRRLKAWYTSASSQNGALRDQGTMRFQPPHSFWGMRNNMLYHPVKPYKTRLRLSLPNPWQQLSSLLKMGRNLRHQFQVR